MSDTGLFTGVYHQVTVFAELIDDVLLADDQCAEEPVLSARRKLGSALSRITANTNNLSTKIVSILIEDSPLVSKSELIQATEKLNQAEIDDTVMDTLERLARVLEEERAKALSRMRGSRR